VTLGCFPDPYPDELLYSVEARFYDRMQFPNASTVSYEFFGEKKIAEAVDLPNRIDRLVAALPPNNRYSAHEFIYKHTFFPLYAPFLPLERAQRVCDEMKGTNVNQLNKYVGVYKCVSSPRVLRFCPACAEEDRSNFGETYWHRRHQVVGIEICLHHSVYLELSTVSRPKDLAKFLSAERSISPMAPHLLNSADPHHSTALKLAHDVEWLLQYDEPPIGLAVIRSRYYNLMLERGYATLGGPIRTSKLINDFENFYSPELLERLQSPISSDSMCWLDRISLRCRTENVQHPLRHLLLITFLGHTVKDFLTSFTEYKPFGESPWPCFNHASEHFQQDLITECHIVRSSTPNYTNSLTGIFRCPCGFTYTRLGPDVTPDDRFRYDRVKDYGPIWERAVRKYWNDYTITIKDAASKLGVTVETLIRHAIRLGLPYPRRAPDVISCPVSSNKRNKMVRPLIRDMLEGRRREWLFVVEANPQANRTQLCKIANPLFRWLNKNDPKWFYAHLPSPRPSRKKKTTINWKQVDLELSTAVMDAAFTIKNTSGRPIRVSKAAIMRRVSYKLRYKYYLRHFPLTVKALSTYIELPEDFALRCVQWAEGFFLREGICPSRSSFNRRARTMSNTGRSRTVQSAIDSAMSVLREHFGSEENQIIVRTLTEAA
jgi:hypothetical protein